MKHIPFFFAFFSTFP
ncbi:hypothetical protein DMZ34_18200 [Escherichia coli]|nr:hypothetical protein [Escherichia coli]EFG3452683.1 hypothetical protein [Escherichia coli]EFI6330400.1 hypothetical protein [Escherichia coli]EFN0932064.1 hypothetical protein [Escherichia coli]EGE1247359.1 hypothetical protein [Escherichia coli]